MLNRIEGVQTDLIAVEAVKQTTNDIRDYNLDQLLNGLDNEGKMIRPTYLEDPYFDTVEEAVGYMEYKRKISPFSAIRPPEAPNLYINGFYHSTRTVKVMGDKIVYDSTFEEADEIDRKYHHKLDGLNPASRKHFIENVLRPLWKRYMEIATRLKME
ncbi:hypothetical protein [Paraflavitalea sp. CAU 1676]|uniref:hypothetical protein n=1 Tax=Paraflavitalea sp. CAU 1676 TaxID=3032598 RepID=UPI0023DC5CE8|nr:hypothetical protein [Paraflavitalea sp. CAU 1676]MDF2189284.1 hypothetical protein [Paraflavitalea sp. CAU 1676]